MPFDSSSVKKVVADSTRKLYKTYLNKLATQGFETPAELLANQKDILEYIKTTPPAYYKSFMNAIFFAISEYPNTEKKIFYDFFQELKKADPRLQEYKKKKAEEEAHPKKTAKPRKKKVAKVEE
jgi:hypothetical protein